MSWGASVWIETQHAPAEFSKHEELSPGRQADRADTAPSRSRQTPAHATRNRLGEDEGHDPALARPVAKAADMARDEREQALDEQRTRSEGLRSAPSFQSFGP